MASVLSQAGSRDGVATSLPVLIDAKDAIAHRGWCSARDTVLDAVGSGPRLILLLGRSGTGKSLLLRELATRLRAAGLDVMLRPRGDMPVQPSNASDGIGRGATRGRVVLVDEAWRLTEASLSGLARLGDCTVVLTGLSERAASGCIRNVDATIVELPLLPADEVGWFIGQRLAQTGLRTELFSNAALSALADRAGGVARQLNRLASAAMTQAWQSGATWVAAPHVMQAAARLDNPSVLDPPAFDRLAMQLGGSGTAVAATTFYPAVAASPLEKVSRQGRLVPIMGAAATIALCCWLAARSIMGVHVAPLAPVLPLAALAPRPIPSPVHMSVPVPVHAPQPPVAAAIIEAAHPPPSRQPVAQPSAPDDLPVAAPVMVLLRYARGSEAASAEAATLATRLGGQGLAVDSEAVQLRPGVGFGVRYFFAEDRASAEAVLAATGQPGESLQASGAAATEVTPRPGLIELIVAGPGAETAATPPKMFATTTEGR